MTLDTQLNAELDAKLDADIAICGAGPVGLALAALLVKNGLPADRITLIDGKALAQSVLDPRSIALSYGSRQILEQVNGWPAAATEIHQIHVSRRGHFGRTIIDRNAHQVPALGYVNRYGGIVAALAGVCEQMGVRVLRPMQLHAVQEQADSVLLQLQTPGALDPFHLKAGLMIQAEGGLFGSQTQKTQHHDYQQTAVIAEVRASATAALQHRAFERFTDEGPLALLPQSNADDNTAGKIGHAYALVWCVKPDTARTLLALDEAQFLAELGQAFGNRLGRFVSATPRIGFALGLNANAGQADGTGRTVSIGNAAQTLHPVAGQGLNLGLRDAAVLAKILGQDISKPSRLGIYNGSAAPTRRHIDPASLIRFEQARRNDRTTTLRLTDTMARIFTTGAPRSVTQGMLGVTLGLLDAFDPAKHLLAELMMYGRRG
jgi:2-octaprenyl-6-methoxyphenol hydroxylase